METIHIDGRSNVPNYLWNLLVEKGYSSYLDNFIGTKYEWANGILTKFIENNVVDTFNPRNSTSWGLLNAYIMFLNQRDVLSNNPIPDTYILTNKISNQDLGYLSVRKGVFISSVFNNSEINYSVRDLISWISDNEFNDFNNWLITFEVYRNV